MWQCWNCPCAGVPLSHYQGCSSPTDETGVSRPRQAVSSAPVAILSEQTPSNGAVTLSLWRRVRENERMERETASPPVKPEHCHHYSEALLMSWKYSVCKACVLTLWGERYLTRFLGSDEMNSRTDGTKSFCGFHHLQPDNCLSS